MHVYTYSGPKNKRYDQLINKIAHKLTQKPYFKSIFTAKEALEYYYNIRILEYLY